MNWHLRPAPNRWDRFFGIEILIIYAKLTGDDKVKKLLIKDPQIEEAITKKLKKELTGWVNDMEKDGYASE